MTKPSVQTQQWRHTRQHILKRDNHTCNYCGNEATTVDHITPRSKGGTHHPTNLVAACHTCNSTKQDKTNTRTNWHNKTWLQKL